MSEELEPPASDHRYILGTREVRRGHCRPERQTGLGTRGPAELLGVVTHCGAVGGGRGKGRTGSVVGEAVWRQEVMLGP